MESVAVIGTSSVIVKPENILELFAMCRISAWENPKVDFIPLFETIRIWKLC